MTQFELHFISENDFSRGYLIFIKCCEIKAAIKKIFLIISDHVADNPSSWSTWKIIVLTVIVIGFVIGIFVLLYAYQKHQEGKRKRFY